MDTLFFQEVLDDVTDGVYFLDTERRITYWSRGAERLTGFRAEEVLGRSCAENVLVHADCGGQILCDRTRCPAASAMRAGSKTEQEVFLKHKAGHRIPVVTRVKPIIDAEGAVTGAVEVFTTAPDYVASESRLKELEQLALLDPLTEVGNRRLGEKELADRVEEAGRYDWKFGVLFVDVDRFKETNDIHGHEVGDRLLRMVARTLSHNVRSSDSVIRWGGEEFLVLLKNVSERQLVRVSEKLRGLVASGSIMQGPFQLRVTVSIGATLLMTEDTPGKLVSRADALMYESKRQGGNRVTIDPPVSGAAGSSPLEPAADTAAV